LGILRSDGVRAGRNSYCPCPCPALASKVDLDADLAEEGRRPPQAPRKGSWATGPGLRFGDALARRVSQDVQKVRRGSRPLRLRGHNSAHSRGNRVAVDYVIHRLVAVAPIGGFEGASWPQRGLARRRPQREIRHARKLLQPDLRQSL